VSTSFNVGKETAALQDDLENQSLSDLRPTSCPLFADSLMFRQAKASALFTMCSLEKQKAILRKETRRECNQNYC
jgi:hypothetical protein